MDGLKALMAKKQSAAASKNGQASAASPGAAGEQQQQPRWRKRSEIEAEELQRKREEYASLPCQ